MDHARYSEHRARLERLAEMTDAIGPRVDLAELELRHGLPVDAIVRLDRALRDADPDDPDRARAQRLRHQIEGKHGILFVERTEYDRVVHRLREQARQTWAHTWSRGTIDLPRKRKKRAIVLHHILEPLDPHRDYSTDEFEAVLHKALADLKLDTDHCHLRRYMIGMKLITRTPDGSVYRINPQSPLRIVEPEPEPDDKG